MKKFLALAVFEWLLGIGHTAGRISIKTNTLLQ